MNTIPRLLTSKLIPTYFLRRLRVTSKGLKSVLTRSIHKKILKQSDKSYAKLIVKSFEIINVKNAL